MKNNLIRTTIYQVLKKNKAMTLGIVLIIISSVGLTLIPPQIMRMVVDEHLVAGKMQGMGVLTASYVLILILIGVSDFLKGCLLTVFGQKIIKNIRMNMMWKLEKISAAFYSKNPTGTITSRFTTDVENVNTLFADGIVSMLIDCLKIIGIVISICVFSLKLGVVSLCLIPLIYIITRYFQKKMLVAQINYLEQLGNVNNHISESLRNVNMVKIFGKETYMESLYAKRLADNFSTKEKVNFYDSCYAPLIQSIRACTIALIVVLSSKQLNFLGISIGMVAASIDLITNLLTPIESLGMELQNVQKGISGVRRINDFYNEKEEEEKDTSLTAAQIIGEHGIEKIHFSHLSFAYETGTDVLKDLEATIPGKANVTFTGRTGVGKTTLFNLIMGLLQPTGGHIYINETDAYKIPNCEKRKIFGYVEQNFQFIQGTVAKQIGLGDQVVTQRQIEDSCRFVGLHEYIMNLEHGYETIVQKGNEFSWGQRQLLAIARAIVMNPPILLLDEITANLDSATEEKVIGVLRQAGEGRTILSISHRMAAIMNCDMTIHLTDAEGKENDKTNC